MARILILAAAGEAARGQSPPAVAEKQPRFTARGVQLSSPDGLGLPVQDVGFEAGPGQKNDRIKYPLDDPFFPGLLLNDEMAPGFELGDTSLPDPLKEEEDDSSAMDPARDASGSPTSLHPLDALNGDTPEGMGVRSGVNAVPIPPRRVVRRSAMNQALGTGDALLGNLGALRGTVFSPFLPAERFDAPPFRLGLIGFRPRASAGLVVGHYSGIGMDGNEDQIGGFGQLGVTATLRESRYLKGAFDYTFAVSTPTGRSRNNGSGNDVQVDQYMALDTDFSFPQFPKVKFGFELDYAGLSGIDRDTGSNVSRTLATGTLMASYAYSRKTSVDWDLAVPVRQFSDGVSSGGATTTVFVNNQITRKTRVGLGLSVGTLRVEGGSDQWFEQLLVRASFHPSSLWTFEGTGGLELREAYGTTKLSPIFGLGASWEPIEGTSVLFAAESRIFNSATALNTNYRSTSFSLTVNQRIGYRLGASLSIGYENAVYEGGSFAGQKGRRKDDLFEASLGLHFPVTRRWSWDLILSAGKNESDFAPFEFYQGVLQTSYQF